MNRKLRLAAALLLTASAETGYGATITFDNNGAQGAFIDSSGAGCNNDTETVNNAGAITNNADGFTVNNFSVTYTADAAGQAGCLFRFSVGFSLDQNSAVGVRVFGNSDVTESAGATGAVLTTPGSVTDSFNATLLTVTADTNVANGASNANFQWDKNGTVNLAGNTDYVLNLFTGVHYNAANAGDFVTVASAYNIQITAVPAPAAVWLFGSGLLGLACWVRRRMIPR